MEEISQHRGCGAGADQSFGLERLDRGFAKTLEFGIEQPAIGTAQAIGLQGPLQRVRLEQDRQARSACAPAIGAEARDVSADHR